MNPSDSVCVAWVHSNEVSYSFFHSMMGLQASLLTGARQGRLLAQRYGSSGISGARNDTVAKFLAGDEDWLLWIDTDMGFTVGDVDELVGSADADTVPVVGGLCFVNRESSLDGRGGYVTGPAPTVYRWAQQPDGRTGFVADTTYERDALVRCDATGSAFILIHRAVLEGIGGDWYTPIDTGSEVLGEDLSFCVRCTGASVPIHVNTAAKTTHHKPIWLSEDHYDAWREAQAPGTLPEFKPSNRAERRRAEREAAKAS